MTAYYNEIDPYAAQWLRNLIDGGHIARGDVDERSIADVRADDLRGYTQAHFFAGIGGWSVALRLAGWPDDRSVWTGSCPCQPFSAAGEGKAADDERHLWPAWFPLIAECRPPVVFGEQVEAAIGWGWLDAVFSDLETEGYSCGASILPACGVGAPHIRNRLWFVADAESRRSEPGRRSSQVQGRSELERSALESDRRRDDGGADELAHAAGGGFGELGNASQPGRGGHADGSGIVGKLDDSVSDRWGTRRNDHGRNVGIVSHPDVASGFWFDAEWIACTDGKSRPVGPGSFPLGHGIRNRPSKLRAYGNAIVPQVAAEFIRAAGEGLA